MEHLFSPENLIALATLTFLEIVLGIDNIIFISIVTNKLPKKDQPRARFIGLSLALIFRVLLLLSLSYIIGLTKPVFSIMNFDVSWRDIILFAGGIFLIAKSVSELHGKVVGLEHKQKDIKAASFNSIIFQIILLDIVFSFDSILTAIGLSNQIPIMITAVVIAIIVMMLFSGPVSEFVNKHVTLQILALSFLILIGFMLIVESLHSHVPKGYIYFAVAFSLLVEVINMRVRKNMSEE